jgi:WD40 repeat protein
MNAMRKVNNHQTRNRQFCKMTTYFAIGFIIMLVITVFAIVQWRRAEQESKIALARQLAAQANSMILAEYSSQDTAVLLAIQSMRLNPSGEAAQTLQNDILVYPKSRTEQDGFIITFAFSSDGKFVVSGSEKRVARVWEISTGEEINTLLHGDSYITSLAFSHDSKYVVSGSNDQSWRNDNTARVWEIATGTEIARMAHDFMVTSVDISPNGNYVVSGAYDGVDAAVHVWDISAGKEVATLPHPGAKTVKALAFSLDGQYVVSGTREDYAVRVWDISTGEEIAHMLHDDYVTAVAFSPDGKYVVAGCDSRGHSLRVWEVSTEKEISRMFHDYIITSVAFSPDGKYVISGSEDLTARVWDAITGKEISRIANIHVRSVAFSPDGKYALVGDFIEIIHIWKWSPEDLITDACSRVARNLTRAEWQKYISSALPYQAVCPNLPIEPVPTQVTVTIPTPY